MHKHSLCCTAQFVAARIVAARAVLVGCLLTVSACGTVEIFGEYDLPESPGVAEAPWPRLVDVPAAPPVGTYTSDVPDPAQGAAQQRDLSVAAVVADQRRQAVTGPVITDAEREVLLRRARRSR